MARSTCDGTFRVIRPTADGAQVEAYTPGIQTGLLKADQAFRVRYERAHENLTVVDAYRDGRSGHVFVLAGAP
jgi:hypothetical protein